MKWLPSSIMWHQVDYGNHVTGWHLGDGWNMEVHSGANLSCRHWGWIWKAAEDQLHPSQHIMGHVAGGVLQVRGQVVWITSPVMFPGSCCDLWPMRSKSVWRLILGWHIGAQHCGPVRKRSTRISLVFFPLNYRGCCSHNLPQQPPAYHSCHCMSSLLETDASRLLLVSVVLRRDDRGFWCFVEGGSFSTILCRSGTLIVLRPTLEPTHKWHHDSLIKLEVMNANPLWTETILLLLNNNYVNAAHIDCLTSTRDVGAH